MVSKLNKQCLASKIYVSSSHRVYQPLNERGTDTDHQYILQALTNIKRAMKHKSMISISNPHIIVMLEFIKNRFGSKASTCTACFY